MYSIQEYDKTWLCCHTHSSLNRSVFTLGQHSQVKSQAKGRRPTPFDLPIIHGQWCYTISWLRYSQMPDKKKAFSSYQFDEHLRTYVLFLNTTINVGNRSCCEPLGHVVVHDGSKDFQQGALF